MKSLSTNLLFVSRLIAFLRVPSLVILNFQNAGSFFSTVPSAVSFLVEVGCVHADWELNCILVNIIDLSGPLGVFRFPLLLILIFDSESLGVFDSELSAVPVVSEVSFVVGILIVIPDCGRFVCVGLGIIGFVARTFSVW